MLPKCFHRVIVALDWRIARVKLCEWFSCTRFPSVETFFSLFSIQHNERITCAVHSVVDIRAFLISILMPILIFLFIIMIWMSCLCRWETCAHTHSVPNIRLCWLLASSRYILLCSPFYSLEKKKKVFRCRRRRCCCCALHSIHINLKANVLNLCSTTDCCWLFLQLLLLLSLSAVARFVASKIEIDFCGRQFLSLLPNKMISLLLLWLRPWFL